MSNAHHHARGEWVTKEGRVIPVAEMETSHLVNVTKLLALTTVKRLREDIDDYAILHDYEDYCPGYLDYSVYLTAHSFWPHLCAELDKRHIDVVKLVNEHLAANGYDNRLGETTKISRFISEDDDNYGLTWPDNL
jgi:hypothetical protein